MKSLLLTAVCIWALGVILAGCSRVPDEVEQPVEASVGKTDAGLGDDGGKVGGGRIPDFSLD
jgi:starvation-inducible outer membrane lipoprotein